MNNNFGFNVSGPTPPQFSLEDLDLSRIYRLIRFGLGLLGLIILWMAVSWGHSFYTDWLWYKSLGYESVLTTIVLSKAGLFFLALGVFALLAVPNLYLARRHTAGLRPANSNVPLNLYQRAIQLLGWIAAGVLLLMGLYFGALLSSEWESILRYLHQSPFNEQDPVFNKDFSFYIFTVPVLEFIKTWLVGAIIGIIILVGGIYYLSSAFRGEVFSFSGRVFSHLAILGAVVLLAFALGHWLDRYELLYSSLGTVYGVGYTDSTVMLPGYTFLTFVALIAAVCIVAGVFSGRRKMIVWPVAAWLGLYVVITFLAPGLVQRLLVEPSELAREKEYLQDNIQHTRNAFGLEQLVSKSHPARGELDRQVIEANQGTIQNIRLWDEGPLLQSYNQIQFFRLYYDFLAVHTDRYTIDGQLRQVMLATRELSADKLPQEAQRWVNRHLQFTHGYGLAASPVTEVEAGGRPSFYISDVPPQGQIELKRPEIYYGLKSLDHLIVRSRMQEFNFPGPEGPEYTHYQGQGGVKLDSFFRRFLYAWKFMDINILISGEITEDSLIQYRRTVSERFTTLAPFLKPDREAYSVVADGRLFWIQDAYTTADRYPYSTPWENSFNYIRNSVKAVVDAYNGSIDFYVADPEDPLIQAYQNIFPDLFHPMEELPEYLQPHLRYPLDLFTVQTQMLLQYHMKDPVVFYNKEDQWSIPMQSSFGESEVLRPYYIVARLPGEDKEEFLLIQPFTPQNRHNLVGWMAARMDGDHYGELILYRFPSGRHVDGPNQVEARIDNDAVISEQFTLWGQVGSEVSRGILLVIPVGDSILYAEPIFLKPDTLEFPELRRIILADAQQVVMHQTLDDSIDALVGELPAVVPLAEEDEAVQAETAAPSDWQKKLQQVIENLQEVVDQLKDLTQ
jgi:hypothetical protein